MSTSAERWERDRTLNGWVMPTAPIWKRLPGIRWVRFAWHGFRVTQHQSAFRGLGMLSSGYDEWVLYGILRGWERPQS